MPTFLFRKVYTLYPFFRVIRLMAGGEYIPLNTWKKLRLKETTTGRIDHSLVRCLIWSNSQDFRLWFSIKDFHVEFCLLYVIDKFQTYIQSNLQVGMLQMEPHLTQAHLSLICVFTTNITPGILSGWHVTYGYLKYEGRVFYIKSPPVLH